MTSRVEGAAGALGAEEDGRAADGLAAHGAGKGAVEQRGAVCVFYYCRTYYKAVRVGGGGEWRTCAMRDDEPRPVWMSPLITH